MHKEIKTLTDFNGLDVGQIVMLRGEEVLFIGYGYVKTCGCCVPNCIESPLVVSVRAEGVDGEIELVEIRSLEEPQPRKVTSIFITRTINKSEKDYKIFRKLLVATKMMPE